MELRIESFLTPKKFVQVMSQYISILNNSNSIINDFLDDNTQNFNCHYY